MATVTYELQIMPSPSNFVEGVELHALINGTPTLLAVNGQTLQPSNTTKLQYDFPVDAIVEWYGKWIGDNGTSAEGNRRTFTAANREQVAAGQALGENFVRFNP